MKIIIAHYSTQLESLPVDGAEKANQTGQYNANFRLHNNFQYHL